MGTVLEKRVNEGNTPTSYIILNQNGTQTIKNKHNMKIRRPMIAVSCLLIKKLVTMMKMTMKVIAMGADKSNLRQQSGQCGPVQEGSY